MGGTGSGRHWRRGSEAPTKDFEGDDPAAFVISANANRRHLTKQQRAACVVAARSWVEVGHNQHSERGDNDCPPSLTNEELAREEGVSVSIIKQVKQGHRDGHGEALRTGEETITSLRKKEARENPRTPVEKLRAAKEELQADNRLLKDEVKQLESSEKARERLQTRVAKLQDDIDYRKGRAETVRTETAARRKRDEEARKAVVAKLRAEITTLKATVKALEAEIEELYVRAGAGS